MARVCAKLDCPKLTIGKKTYCPEHDRERMRRESAARREYDRECGSRHERGYDSKWVKARAGYLAKHPWCVMCAEQGQRVPATVVDHKRPHRGDMKLFWDRDNWQGLCATHHSSTKQRAERSGVLRGCDAQGNPLDPDHPWHRK